MQVKKLLDIIVESVALKISNHYARFLYTLSTPPFESRYIFLFYESSCEGI